MTSSVISRPTLLLLLIATCARATATFAHDSRPLFVELDEVAPQTYDVLWKSPASLGSANLPRVALPDTCTPQSRQAEYASADGIVRRSTYRCSAPLARRPVTIKYPHPNPSISTLIRYKTLSGELHTALLDPQHTAWVVPPSETVNAVAMQYFFLGVHHISSGLDHVLFLVCLLWIARSPGQVLVTVSGFTVAHSVTLALSALDLLQLPSSPVEAAIALSVAFVAAEIARGPQRDLTWRYPVAVSSSFGLLHGLGFATALREVGLPQTEVMTGLLFFNVGVEAGQVVIVIAAFALLATLRSFAARLFADASAASLRTAFGYVIGTQAVFWFLERVSVAFRIP